MEETGQHSLVREGMLKQDSNMEDPVKPREWKACGSTNTWANLFRRDSNWRDSKDIAEKIRKIQTSAKGRIRIDELDLNKARKGGELILYGKPLRFDNFTQTGERGEKSCRGEEGSKSLTNGKKVIVGMEIDSEINNKGAKIVMQVEKMKVEFQLKKKLTDMNSGAKIIWETKEIMTAKSNSIDMNFEFNAKKDETMLKEKQVAIEKEVNELDRILDKLSESFSRTLENQYAEEDFIEGDYSPASSRERKKDNIKTRRWGDSNCKLFNIPVEYKGNKIKKRRVAKECGALKGDEDPCKIGDKDDTITG
ncbi:hypothetical protein Cni_G14134 [Canna indica]|uniref:Uncharacterized protein n=1 Tax=Canna indica TaxID=4628 RepID=A0AAQ3QAD8_9LILI|nr:hypothetical protein Cni_G14134 [Canna indica]